MIRNRIIVRKLMEDDAKLRVEHNRVPCAWYDCADLLNEEEMAAIKLLWSEMPGSTCSHDALVRWMKGENPLGDFVPDGSTVHWTVYYRKVRDDWDRKYIYGFPTWAFVLTWSAFDSKLRPSEVIRELDHYRELNEGQYYWRNL